MTQSNAVSNNCIPYCMSVPHSERMPDVGLGVPMKTLNVTPCWLFYLLFFT